MCYYKCTTCESKEQIDCVFYGYGDSGICECFDTSHGSAKK